MKRIFVVILLAVMGVGSFFVSDPAQAIRITMKRIIFEGSRRAEVLTIVNNGNEEKTYRIGWRHFRMTKDKSLLAVPEDALTPDIKPVVDMVRFAPRRFTIPPGASQQVRLMLRTPAGLEDGEYRSHLWIRPEPDVEGMKFKEEMSSSGQRGVSLKLLAGVTMPVIVRKGVLDAAVSITDLTATESGGFVTTSFSLNRVGERSVYGDIEYTCDSSGGSYVLKTSRGMAIYPEVNQRHISLRIEKLQDKARCSVLSVKFIETSGFQGTRQKVMAEEKAQVN